MQKLACDCGYALLTPALAQLRAEPVLAILAVKNVGELDGGEGGQEVSGETAGGRQMN